MKILVDMNLSPEWLGVLSQQGWSASHWQDVGSATAPHLLSARHLPASLQTFYRRFHPFHAGGGVFIGAVAFNGDRAVPLGFIQELEALPVVVAGDAEDLLAGEPGGFEGAVHGVHHGAAQLGGEADGLLHILHAEGGAVGAHHGIGAVNLGDIETLFVEVTAQRARVGLERDAGIVAERLDEVLAVDDGDLAMALADGKPLKPKPVSIPLRVQAGPANG